MRLKDQIALVTGGSRGIGRAVVKAFAAEGAKVAVVYRGSKEAAGSLLQEIAQTGGVARAYQADVADPAAAGACVEQVEKELGPVDILVNNAGVIQDDLFVRLGRTPGTRCCKPTWAAPSTSARRSPTP